MKSENIYNRVYYGHSMKMYDTDAERDALRFIRERFPNLICPNNDIGDSNRGMHVYLKIVAWSDLVIVSEYQSHIGRGVFDEVSLALKLNKSVYCLRKVKDTHKFYRITDLVVVDENDWSVKYGKVVVQKRSQNILNT